jgi:hypothetical protein
MSLNQLAPAGQATPTVSTTQQHQPQPPAAPTVPSQPFVMPPEMLAQIFAAAMSTPQGQDALRQISALIPPAVPPQPAPVAADDESGHQEEGHEDDGENV